jgi:hypothetical protein
LTCPAWDIALEGLGAKCSRHARLYVAVVALLGVAIGAWLLDRSASPSWDIALEGLVGAEGSRKACWVGSVLLLWFNRGVCFWEFACPAWDITLEGPVRAEGSR